jgi:hypothetical protein
VAVAVSSTGALNVDAATLGESVAVAVSSTGALNVDASTLGESVAVAASAKTERKAARLKNASVAVAVSSITAAYITPPKLHPVLLPPSVEFVAFQVAPPVAVDLLIEQKETDTVPLALDNVWLAAVTEPMVIRFPAVPDKLKLVNVLVVAAVNRIDAG